MYCVGGQDLRSSRPAHYEHFIYFAQVAANIPKRVRPLNLERNPLRLVLFHPNYRLFDGFAEGARECQN
jgi:hypothetical protein